MPKTQTNSTVTITIPSHQASLVQEFLDLANRLEQLPSQAPPAELIDTCEQMVVSDGRELLRKLLEKTTQNGIDQTEKKTT